MEPSSPSSAELGRLVRELEEYCKSDDLSIRTLRSRTGLIPAEAVADSDLLYHACANKRVNRAIVEHLLWVYPDLARKKTDVQGPGINLSWRGCPVRCGEYPLHALCRNCECKSNAAIDKILHANPEAAKHDLDVYEHTNFDKVICTTALHLYLKRETGIKMGTVECLVRLYPESLTRFAPFDKEGDRRFDLYQPLDMLVSFGRQIPLQMCRLLVDDEHDALETRGGRSMLVPVGALLHNPHITEVPLDVLTYMVERTRLTGQYPGGAFGNLMHYACKSKLLTKEIFAVLMSRGVISDLICQADFDGRYPLDHFCDNRDLQQGCYLPILKILVKKFPEATKKDELPIHYAIEHMPTDCCKLLVDTYPGSVTVLSHKHSPFHSACAFRSLKLVKFMYQHDPECLSQRTQVHRDFLYDDDDSEEEERQGDLAIHLAVNNMHKDRSKIVQFILSKDPNQANILGRWGRTALHAACASNCLDLDCVRTIFHALPEVIHTADAEGRIPIHFVFGCHELREEYEVQGDLPHKQTQMSVVKFLMKQLPYSLKRSSDKNGYSCVDFAAATSQAIQKMEIIEELCPEIFYKFYKRSGCPNEENIVVFLSAASSIGAGADIAQYFEKISPGIVSFIHEILFPRVYEWVKNPELFQYLLSRLFNGGPYFHKFLQHPRLLEAEPKRKHISIAKFMMQFKHEGEAAAEPFQTDYKAKDRSGAFPLHYIFKTRTIDINVKHLLGLHPSAADQADSKGWYPLQHAIRHKSSQPVLDELIKLSSGSTVSSIDNQGSTIFHIAGRYGLESEPMQLLRSKIDCYDSFCLTKDKTDCTAIHIASRHGLNINAYKEMIGNNANVFRMKDRLGENPLHKACRGGHLEIIELLLEKDITALRTRNVKGELPLHILARGAGKDSDILDSVEYTEAIFMLLLSHPEVAA